MRLICGALYFYDAYAQVYTKIFPLGYVQLSAAELVAKVSRNAENRHLFAEINSITSVEALLNYLKKHDYKIKSVDFSNGELDVTEDYSSSKEDHWSEYFYSSDLPKRPNNQLKRSLLAELYKHFQNKLSICFLHQTNDSSSFLLLDANLEAVAGVAVTETEAQVILGSALNQDEIASLSTMIEKVCKVKTATTSAAKELAELSFAIRSDATSTIENRNQHLLTALYEREVESALTTLPSNDSLRYLKQDYYVEDIDLLAYLPETLPVTFGELITRWAFAPKGHTKNTKKRLRRTLKEIFGTEAITAEQADQYIHQMIDYILKNLAAYFYCTFTPKWWPHRTAASWDATEQSVSMNIYNLTKGADADFIDTSKAGYPRLIGLLELLVSDVSPKWEEVIYTILIDAAATSGLNLAAAILEEIYEEGFLDQELMSNIARICYAAATNSAPTRYRFIWQEDPAFEASIAKLRQKNTRQETQRSLLESAWPYVLGEALTVPTPHLGRKNNNIALTREVLEAAGKSVYEAIALNPEQLSTIFAARKKASRLVSKSVKTVWAGSLRDVNLVDPGVLNQLPVEARATLDMHFRQRIEMLLSYLLDNFGLHSKTVSILRGNNRAYAISESILHELQSDPQVNWIMRLDEANFSSDLLEIWHRDPASAHLWILNLFTKILLKLNIQTKKNFAVYNYLGQEAYFIPGLAEFLQRFLQPFTFKDTAIDWAEVIVSLFGEAHTNFALVPNAYLGTEKKIQRLAMSVNEQLNLSRFITNNPDRLEAAYAYLAKLFSPDLPVATKLRMLKNFSTNHFSVKLNDEALYRELGLNEYYALPDPEKLHREPLEIGYKFTAEHDTATEFLIPITQFRLNQARSTNSPYAQLADGEDTLSIYNPYLSDSARLIMPGKSVVVSPTSWDSFLIFDEDASAYMDEEIVIYYLLDGSVELVNNSETEIELKEMRFNEGRKPDHPLAQQFDRAYQLSPWVKSIDFEPLHEPVEVRMLFPETITFTSNDARSRLYTSLRKSYHLLSKKLRTRQHRTPEFFKLATQAADSLSRFIALWKYDLDFLERNSDIAQIDPYQFWQTIIQDPQERFKCSEAVIAAKTFWDALGVPCEIETSLHGRYTGDFNGKYMLHRFRHARLRILNQIAIDPTPTDLYPENAGRLERLFSEAGLPDTDNTAKGGIRYDATPYTNLESDFSHVKLATPTPNEFGYSYDKVRQAVTREALAAFDYDKLKRLLLTDEDALYNLMYLEDLFCNASFELPEVFLDEDKRLTLQPKADSYEQFMRANPHIQATVGHERFFLSPIFIPALKVRIKDLRKHWARTLGFTSESDFSAHISRQYNRSDNLVIKLFIRILLGDLRSLEWIIENLSTSPLPNYRPWRNIPKI
jgi:hypothetical protein